MTLDTLTRASAELKHVQLKGSLAQARTEFRDRFKQDAELFRTLPLASSAVPLSPIAHPQASASPTAATAASPLLLGEDLVRAERLTQCCKRVRVWKRQTTNPLLAYKPRSAIGSGAGASSAAASAPGAGSGGTSGSSKPGGNTSAADHRMHLSLLMTMIVDMYEQKMTAEVSATSVLLPVAGISESFPEFAVKYVSARATSRRAAVDQVHTMVAMLMQPSAHPRVRTFAALCGLDGAYNPPEKLRAFLHMIESVHRLKVAGVTAAAATAPVPGAAPAPASVKAEDASSLAEVVFYNLGVPLAVAHKVIAELFEEEYFWNFRFWHSHFAELRLQYAWPAAAKAELEEKTLALTTVSRSAALNAAKKIDTDAFLELLLETWTQRAKTLCDMLEAATNEEERKSAALLAHKQAAQDARGHIAPVSAVERRLFDELVEEFWNAEVPWTTDPKIQRRVTAACEGARSAGEMASLYRKHVAELDDRKKVWLWTHWPWDPEWEWGLLVVRGHEAETQTSTTASSPPAVLQHGATDSATIAAAAAGRAM